MGCFIISDMIRKDVVSHLRICFTICFEKLPYSGGHISWHELFLAGNQDNHQNIVPSLVSNKL